MPDHYCVNLPALHELQELLKSPARPDVGAGVVLNDFTDNRPPALLGQLAAVFTLPLYVEAVTRLVGADSKVKACTDDEP
jgi:hypothetical protein